MTVNQGLAGQGGATLFPATARALKQRNERLRSLSAMPPAQGNPAHSALTLPEPLPPA
ncbi:hypothetical protein ACIP3A_27540 [Streptomyces tricolor]|uniref:hypothetical protein n=1 Tax=Streptomyces tricolor TaxID=68277 RepID=UPI00380273A7